MKLRKEHNKSKYVGNHGGAYTDESGMSRQFTYVDHDKKTKISTMAPIPEKELVEAKEQFKKFKEKTIEGLLSLPASLCPHDFNIFTKINDQKIEWDESVVRDPSIDIWRLVGLKGMIEDKI